MSKQDFCLCKNKGANQLRSYCTADQHLFSTRMVLFLLYLYPTFQDSSFLLRMYRLVCVRPGWKSRRSVFLRHGSYILNLNNAQDKFSCYIAFFLNRIKAAPVAERLTALFLNHSIISLLCLVWVRAPHWPHVRQAKFCLQVRQVVFLGVLLFSPTY